MDKDKKVCFCRNVNIGDIEKCVEKGAKTFEDIQHETGLGTSCTGCVSKWKDKIENYIKTKNF